MSSAPNVNAPADVLWNQRYGEPGFAYGEAPNAYLAEMAPRYLPAAARVFVPADGEGRNGVWLARQGYRVSSLDLSTVGIAKAQALAARYGVSLDARHGDLLSSPLEESAYDGLVSIYAHMPPQLRTALHARWARALKPDGVLIIEGFAREQLGRSSGGPKDLLWLYTVAQIRDEFSPWLEFLSLEKAVVELDEGPYHRGEAVVVRGVARRRHG